ncbi:hypothetical protein BDB01DRAFT_774603 [Pilobolus umbonatus]|nr:hypothetical protein BDB01DRAFT_774603 [Pilobolus umbonatus]
MIPRALYRGFTPLRRQCIAPASYSTSKKYISTLGSDKNEAASEYNPQDEYLEKLFNSDLDCKQKVTWFGETVSPSSLPSTGLFEHPYFTSTDGIEYAAKQAIQRAQILVERICNAPTNGPGEMRKVVLNLDRLSEILCSVIDMCEFIRNAHPTIDIMDAANLAYSELYSYMNTLNIDTRIHKTLSMVLSDQSIVNSLSPDERASAVIFMQDFEKSGIHLPNKQRAKFVELSDKTISLGRDFLQKNPRGIEVMKISPQALDGVNPGMIISRVRRDGYAYIPTDSSECQMILKYANNENVRRHVYESINSANKKSIKVLEELMKTRAALALLVGNNSYAELQLQHKMAKNPENVDAFLRTLLKHQSSSAKEEIQLLQNTKRQRLNLSNGPTTIQAWDRDYYIRLYKESKITAQSILNSPTPIFSVGSVIQGLSRLFDHLYGVRFEPVSVKPGEAWHKRVRKLNVVCEKEGKIGTIYCDLFSRMGKTANAAHYTIRTSRRIDHDDPGMDTHFAFPGKDVDTANFMPPMPLFGEPSRIKKGLYQLPVIVLTCDFFSRQPEQPTLLSLLEVETLFHEMGHAMHSMLGRTDFHNIAGTRCASDFVELPSILMEHFVCHPKVLPLFLSDKGEAKDKKLFIRAVEDAYQQKKKFSSLEVNSQILMALIDQRYHSSVAMDDNFSSVSEWHKLQDEVGLFPSVPGTMWPVQFGHLFGYGSNYYSYLFDRTLARKIWDSNFEADPLNREKGQALRDGLLKWGGVRDPWKCVSDVIGGEDGARIVNGDEEAMKIVGDWGIDV